MLALDFKEGEFVMIGDTLIRVCRCSPTRARVSIDTPSHIRVLRFDENGQLKTGVRPLGIEKHPEGGYLVKLGCGHSLRRGAEEKFDVVIQCEQCLREAQAIRGRIERLAIQTEKKV